MDALHLSPVNVKATKNFCEVIIVNNYQIIIDWHDVPVTKSILAREEVFYLKYVTQW